MMRVFSRLVLGISLAICMLMGLPAIALAQPEAAELAKAVQEVENLDAMRSSLAAYLEDATEPPTAETMRQVCKPVGMKAMQLSKDNGWQVKQIANKYRNSAHKPETLQAKMALAQFEHDPDLQGFWASDTLNGAPGTRYYRRINVEASCLACHGGKGDRPQFVKDNYPQDLAYDFNVGDLRGMYSVFIPEVKQALEDVLSAS
ncbi:MAG: DUF3365 domain-containing protein [Leptolyngbyaceae cyanobacterium SM1_1_3]|nr:DUF3365 domain-containing protein [Leptolyngbyaceae cyanobacterium SM1_1_3]NJN01678.1 DUF3365 domain-containing protein [Leptolyngbyaceae cyanobacterium RM1_1_2]NJO11819.1 DUF3365 domain-containing protein [Leptolyngbyaceae cyanobacterium SL_1_1]